MRPIDTMCRDVSGNRWVDIFGEWCMVEPVDAERWQRAVSGRFDAPGDARGPEWTEHVRRHRSRRVTD